LGDSSFAAVVAFFASASVTASVTSKAGAASGLERGDCLEMGLERCDARCRENVGENRKNVGDVFGDAWCTADAHTTAASGLAGDAMLSDESGGWRCDSRAGGERDLYMKAGGSIASSNSRDEAPECIYIVKTHELKRGDTLWGVTTAGDKLWDVTQRARGRHCTPDDSGAAA
jgi:hypothetical protein